MSKKLKEKEKKKTSEKKLTTENNKKGKNNPKTAKKKKAASSPKSKKIQKVSQPVQKNKKNKSELVVLENINNSEAPKIEFNEQKFEKEVIVNNQRIKKSSHLLNLKNPHQEQFAEDIKDYKKTPLVKPKSSLNTNPPKSPKSTFRKSKKIGINLIDKNNFNQLSVISLIKIIFWPIKFLVPRKSNKKIKIEERVEPKPQVNNVFVEEDVEDIFAISDHKNKSSFYIPQNCYRKVAAFAVIAAILILPLEAFTYYQDLQSTKDKILLITSQAVENLKQAEHAAISLDLDDASLQFGKARDNFDLAQQEIDTLSNLTTEIIKLLPGQGQSVSAGLNLLAAGEIIADAGQILITNGNNFIESKTIEDYYNSLIIFKSNLKTVINKFNEAENKIKQIKPSDLPSEHQETFNRILTYLPTVKKGLTDIYIINDSFLRLLGHEQWQRYLLIFMNNNELRGGGGFMGTFGILDIDRGSIKNLEIPGGGTYDIQGQLVPKVIAPEPLHLINSRWEFQDSNWWPDFPTTAKKIQWFYQNADGPSTDGVIAITSTLMEDLLEIFGPIPMDEYGREIDNKNFVLETQKIVQLEYDKEENRPKQFLADLAPKLIQKIFNADKDQLKKLVELTKKSLNQKHLLVYFNDQQTENIIENFGWSGEIKQTEGDYLSVVHTNLAGGKTDGSIKETIHHQAEVQSDGSIINTVRLIRRHSGVRNEDIFTGVQNNSYVRFYVPMGSELLGAEGFKRPPQDLFEEPLPEYQNDVDLITVESEHQKDENTGTDVYKESGKTVFGNWLQLQPGEVQEVTIKYRLPLKVYLEGQNTFYYSLLIQKQLGSLGSEFKSNLKLNDKLKILAKFPIDLPSDDDVISFGNILDVDQFYGAVLVNK